MKKIRSRLDAEEKRAFDYLLKKHKDKNCECFLSDAENIVLCPIGLYKDGCIENQLIAEIREFAETWKDEDFMRG